MSGDRASAHSAGFAALADPTRRSILGLLHARGVLSAGELARAFPHISRPAVSRHLRVLRESGLVTVERSGREQRYVLGADALARLHHEWFSRFTG
ncbi:MAG TPA: metalloregulator ArsR/SmtB family transcription factor, partial [Planctomycetota bacterium]|nr:metalloregulator ArsR/SmtB family transcription factor [Planctomycetota bacterium]